MGDLSAAIINNLLVGVFSRFLTDLSKERGKAIVIVHGPAVKGVIMALRALNAGAHKNLSDILSALHDIVFQLEVVRGRIFESAAPGCQQVEYDLIKWLITGNLVSEPFIPEKGGFVADLIRIIPGGANLQEFGPLHAPHLCKFLPFQETINQGLSFVWILTFNEFLSLLFRWENSRDVQIDPAREDFITARIGGVNSQLVKLGMNQLF